MNQLTLSVAVARALASSGHFALQLGSGANADISLLESSEGGNVFGEVVTEPNGPEPFPKKHLGPPQRDDLVVHVGLSMSNALFDWIAGAWTSQPQTKDGAVLATDFKLDVKTALSFGGALITEMTVPTLDAASKDTGLLTVKFSPSTVAAAPASGKLSLAFSKQKLWRTSNFRLQIAGIDCTRVSKIESFTVKREVATDQTSSLIPGDIDFPNLTITLSQVGSQAWHAWHEDFVLNGNNGEGFERNGSISFLSPDLKTELSRIDLRNLGIMRLAAAPTESGQVTRLIAELYCEEMVLTHPGGGS